MRISSGAQVTALVEEKQFNEIQSALEPFGSKSFMRYACGRQSTTHRLASSSVMILLAPGVGSSAKFSACDRKHAWLCDRGS
jgi:hypothetical protein